VRSRRGNDKHTEALHALEYGGQFRAQHTAPKVLQSSFYWPTMFKDAHAFVTACDRCQHTGNISRQNEMPLQNILEVKLLMFGALISWDFFLHPTTINTFS